MRLTSAKDEHCSFLAELVLLVFFLWPVQCGGGGGGVCIRMGFLCLKLQVLHYGRSM